MMPLDCTSVVFDTTDEDLELGALRVQNAKLKRVIDFVGSAVGLVFLAPFFLLVAIIIRVETPGPILFRQVRSGLNGAAFTIYKFRSMRVVEDGSTIVQASRDDCRTTRFGVFLRRSSIDELPNLINVLRGEMSLVGPRPHALAHDQYYRVLIPSYSARYMTRPGITGLAQVEGLRGRTKDVNLMAARVERDIEYIRRWSFGLDVMILFRTLLVGAFHPAAY
jgi:putative colanic acid biosynthesis UDP-glucose lipid carrier transferase